MRDVAELTDIHHRLDLRVQLGYGDKDPCRGAPAHPDGHAVSVAQTRSAAVNGVEKRTHHTTTVS